MRRRRKRAPPPPSVSRRHEVVAEHQVVQGEVANGDEVDHIPSRSADHANDQDGEDDQRAFASGWAKGLTPERFRMLLRMPIIKAPRNVPITPPCPPKSEVPPTTTAAIASNRRPSPAIAGAAAN